MKPIESIRRLFRYARILAQLIVLSVTVTGLSQEPDLDEEDDSPFASGLVTNTGTISPDLLALDSTATAGSRMVHIDWRLGFAASCESR